MYLSHNDLYDPKMHYSFNSAIMSFIMLSFMMLPFMMLSLPFMIPSQPFMMLSILNNYIIQIDERLISLLDIANSYH